MAPREGDAGGARKGPPPLPAPGFPSPWNRGLSLTASVSLSISSPSCLHGEGSTAGACGRESARAACVSAYVRTYVRACACAVCWVATLLRPMAACGLRRRRLWKCWLKRAMPSSRASRISAPAPANVHCD